MLSPSVANLLTRKNLRHGSSCGQGLLRRWPDSHDYDITLKLDVTAEVRGGMARASMATRRAVPGLLPSAIGLHITQTLAVVIKGPARAADAVGGL